MANVYRVLLFSRSILEIDYTPIGVPLDEFGNFSTTLREDNEGGSVMVYFSYLVNEVLHGNPSQATTINLAMDSGPQPAPDSNNDGLPDSIDMSSEADDPENVIKGSPGSGEYVFKVFTKEGTPWVTFIPNIANVSQVLLFSRSILESNYSTFGVSQDEYGNFSTQLRDGNGNGRVVVYFTFLVNGVHHGDSSEATTIDLTLL
ncbi:hypothetical protein [Xanthovirga aplysinae]|uniref:hypothetical protein n=1 Tax=Xanthovirga aplysinae TaxID=2529853 RepID=UPI0012BD827C|nr:hypothetical protein [Xanthovirga aplysinae]MTI29494.1 hypothetical protein [Xanthovirga aplysinae]